MSSRRSSEQRGALQPRGGGGARVEMPPPEVVDAVPATVAEQLQVSANRNTEADAEGTAAGAGAPEAAADEGGGGAQDGGDTAEEEQAAAKAKRKDNRSAMAKKLGWGAPKRRRKKAAAPAANKAAAAVKRPVAKAKEELTPAEEARAEAEDRAREDAALARALQEQFGGGYVARSLPSLCAHCALPRLPYTLLHSMYGGRQSRKPKVFDPVAEAARPQLAYSSGAGPRMTGRAANSAAMSSADLCCDKCETWYTTQEVGLSVDEAKALRAWHCGICLGTHKSRDAKVRAKAAALVFSPVERKRPCPPPGPPPDRVMPVSPAPPTHQPPSQSPRETATVNDAVSSPGLQQNAADTCGATAEGEGSAADAQKKSTGGAQTSVAAITAAQTAAIQQQWKQQQSAAEGEAVPAAAVPAAAEPVPAVVTPPVATSELDAPGAQKETAEKPEDKKKEAEEDEAAERPVEEAPAAVVVAREEDTPAAEPVESIDSTPVQAAPDAAVEEPSASAAPPKFTVGCSVFMKFEESDRVLRDWAGRVDEIADETRLMKITFEDGGTETDVDPADPDLRLRAPKRMYGKQVKGAAPDAKKAQVSFQWKNPDFLFKNPDFPFKNPDFLFKNPDFIIKRKNVFFFIIKTAGAGRRSSERAGGGQIRSCGPCRRWSEVGRVVDGRVGAATEVG